MNPKPVAVLSELDYGRFGVRTARADDVTAASLGPVLEFCRSHEVVFLIARCSTQAMDAVHAMQRGGFTLMDTAVCQLFDSSITAIPDQRGDAVIRDAQPGEGSCIADVAAASFAGFTGHYHADPRLDPRLCDQVYTSWAKRSAVSRAVADQVLVAQLDGQIAGFLTLKIRSPACGDLGLGGVLPSHRRLGIFRSLFVGAIRWFASRAVPVTSNTTQVTNVAVQGICYDLGFKPSHSQYTFHKWFDEPEAGHSSP